MPKWLPIPIAIDAVRWLGVDDDEQPQFDTFNEPTPKWLTTAFKRNRLYIHRRTLMLSTRRGIVPANRFDYICRGQHGEIYNCDPIAFERQHRLAA